MRITTLAAALPEKMGNVLAQFEQQPCCPAYSLIYSVPWSVGAQARPQRPRLVLTLPSSTCFLARLSAVVFSRLLMNVYIIIKLLNLTIRLVACSNNYHSQQNIKTTPWYNDEMIVMHMQPQVQLKYIMADHEFRVNSPQTQRFLPKVTRRFSQSSWLGVNRIWRQRGPTSHRASRIASVRVMSFVTAGPPKSCWVAGCAAASQVGPWNIAIVWRWKQKLILVWTFLDISHSWTFVDK